MTSLAFYGGINEIGGNKFLLEDKGTKVFLDFGMQMGKANQYFAEFTQPRGLNGMGDLFELGLLPKLHGLYRRDYSKHMEFDGDYNNDTDFDGVLLTHAHVDHCAYIHYLRPEIPIYCTEESKLIMQTFQDTGGNEQYIDYKENFKFYENKKGGMSRATKEDHREERKRTLKIIEPYKKFKIDSIEVEPVPVDHSLPGVCGFIIHTSNGTIGYTADLRFHGRRKEESEKFIERCADSNLDHLLCEGTRLAKDKSQTEYQVEDDVKNAVNATSGLVVVTYPVRDLDRLESFYLAAKETGRHLVIDHKQAYLLNLFDNSEKTKGKYPGLDDPVIKIFNRRKSWGMLGRTTNEDMLLSDYKIWERDFIGTDNSLTHSDVSANSKDYMLFCSDFSLTDLIDVRPPEGSSYIRSSTEPFDDEMAIDQERVKRWLVHFGLLKKDENWTVTHVSGHGSRDQIQRVVEGSNAKALIPIHTEDDEYFDRWHKNVHRVELDKTINI